MAHPNTVQTYTFVVNTDAGETGTSETHIIDGILDSIDLVYSGDADAGTNVYLRENNAGTILNVHEELANNNDKAALPSRKSPWLADGAYNVYVDSAGGSYNAVVTVIARVLIG